MYNEYSASEGKVLLNIRNFTYGFKIISSDDLSAYLYETTKEVAEEYATKYSESTSEQQNTVLEEELKIKRAALNTPMKARSFSENDDGLSESSAIIEENTKRIEDTKTQLLVELLSSDSPISRQNIKVIKHE